MRGGVVTVRRVQEAEWAALRDLRLRALSTDPRAFGASHAEEAALPEAEWRQRAAGGPDLQSFVAERDGAWVGMVTTRAAEGEVEVLGLWVAPEARGCSVGDALLRAAHAWARERKAARVHLWVILENVPALRLYGRAGYVVVGPPRQGRRDPTRWFQQMAARLDE